MVDPEGTANQPYFFVISRCWKYAGKKLKYALIFIKHADEIRIPGHRLSLIHI